MSRTRLPSDKPKVTPTPVSTPTPPPHLPASLRALAEVCPWVDPPPVLPAHFIPTTGRDGSPTFKTPTGWWRNCSVPRAASRAMLDGFQPSAVLSCFLHPMHPAALREVLDRLAPDQAVVALLAPADSDELPAFLACDDFTPDLRQHRLFFARHPHDLEQLLLAHPGLPTPGQFIRTVAIDDDTCRATIDACQAVFARVHTHRTALVRQLHATTTPASTLPRTPPTRVIVSASSKFQLWNDAADLLTDLAAQLSGVSAHRWTHDDPLHTAPLALALLARDADAILLANLVRADLNGQVPPHRPLLTLATSPRVPPPSDEPRDRVILTAAAIPDAWIHAGWAKHQLIPAHLPPLLYTPHPAPSAHAPVGLFADTRPIQLPPAIEEYSSHRLLWERALAEVTADPAVLAEDAPAYLVRLQHEMGVDPVHFPFDTFLHQLIIPAWQQSVARHLLDAGSDLRIYGHGWDRLDPPSPAVQRAWRGPLSSTDDLREATAPCAALLRPAPLPGYTPAQRLGRPLLAIRGTRSQWLRPLAPPAPPPNLPLLTPALLAQLLSQL